MNLKMTDAQKTLYYIAENMKMEKKISDEGYEHFQQAIKALEQSTSEDCVSRAEVLNQLKEWRDCEFVKMTNPYHYLEKRIQSMSPVKPTHSTCKDCSHRGAIYANGECYCDNDGTLRERNFYCKDFDKRGNENEID